MLNKIIILFILLTLNTQKGHSQFSPKKKGKISFVRLKKSETYVVLTEVKELNEALKNAITNNWTLNKVNFITEDEFMTFSKDLDKSFIYFNRMKRKGKKKLMNVFALVNGGYDQKAIYLSNTLAYISIDEEGSEKNNIDVIYRLPNIVSQLQKIVSIVSENNISKKTEEEVRDRMINIYCKNSPNIKEKTLLIDNIYLNKKIPFKEEGFLKLYKYKVKFVDKKIITDAIKEKKSDFVYLVSSLNIYKINTITDCETGAILYVDFAEEFNPKHRNSFNKGIFRFDILNMNYYIKRKRL